MPMARQPRMMFFSPVRSSSSAALTPSRAPWPSVYTPPRSAGIRPAIARSSVDLPEPFRPIRPTASPRLATKETPLIACTSRIEGRRCLRSIRIIAVAAVPLSPPAPYTRYTTCRSSTTTIGSATAVLPLRPPEEDEAHDQDHDRPERAEQPQAGLADQRVAVGAVEQVRGEELLGCAGRRVVVRRAQGLVVRPGPRHALPLRLQQRVPRQRDVDRRRVVLQDPGDRRVMRQVGVGLDAEHH